MTEEMAYAVLAETARRNGVSLEEVLREIKTAIAAGMADPRPEVRARWRRIPAKGAVPTPAEAICYFSERIKTRPNP